jgi:serine/threonine-protein kinase HipA
MLAWQPAANYLRGLLPEGRHLQAAAAAANVATTDTYGLLRRYGRDVAGALVIGPSNEEPDDRRWGVEPYSHETLALAVGALDEGGDIIEPDSELSIAGLQNKLLLVRTGGGWGRPTGGRPSTHILKLDDPTRPGLVAAEHHALLLGKRAGVTDLNPQLESIANRACLIVERFDRRSVRRSIVRVHQEDICQALGVNHEARQGRGKYESGGGPTFTQTALLLSTYAIDATAELQKLAALMTFTVLVANADAHGKNIALLHSDDGAVSLAPAYDTVPTALWPALRTNPAMSIGHADTLDRVSYDDLIGEARRWGLSSDRAQRAIRDTIERVEASVVDHETLAELVAGNVSRLSARSS